MLRLTFPSRSFPAVLLWLAVCHDSAAAQTVAPPSARSAPGIDPVAAAVTEASRRFGVPEHWIRAVMRVESAGDVDAVSRAGAMGLMQVMPGTYAELRLRYGLGPDPFAIRDNILAGAAYLREMHDRYGATGMLAAYNAGPGRWEDHVARGRPLPGETLGYLARLDPVVGASAVSAPALPSSPPPPSPFASPIFVALHSRQSDAPPPVAVAETGRMSVDAMTAAPSDGGMFARAGRAEVKAMVAQPSEDSPTASATARAPAEAAVHALFAVRRGGSDQ